LHVALETFLTNAVDPPVLNDTAFTGPARNPAAGLRRQIVLNAREETMKMRLVVALAGLAISFALPTFAQQKESTPNERDRLGCGWHASFD
jgi:hypothetical protein